MFGVEVDIQNFFSSDAGTAVAEGLMWVRGVRYTGTVWPKWVARVVGRGDRKIPEDAMAAMSPSVC